jgi:hypothetical protein
MFQIKPSSIHLISQIEFKPDKEENPFEKARIENERIENKQELERRKLSEFKLKVKQRLVLYKYAESKLDKDFKINFSLNKTPIKIKSTNQAEGDNKEKGKNF